MAEKNRKEKSIGVVDKIADIFDQYANFVDSLFSELFGKVGHFVGSKPVIPILLSLVLVILCSLGFMNFYSESRSDKLWVPQDTQGQDDKELYQSFFQEVRVEFVLIEAKNEDTMLSKDLLQDAMTIYEQVHALNVKVDGKIESFSTLCMKDYSNGDPCLVESVLENWMYNSTTLAAEASDASILSTLNADNEVADVKNVLGDIKTNSGNGDIESAQAAMIFFFIEDNKRVVGGVMKTQRQRTEEFLNFIENPSSYGFYFPNVNLYRFATRSWGDEFGDAIAGDIGLLVFAYLVLLIYVIFNLGKPGQKCVHMRVSLSVIVLITVGLAIAASTGLCSAFGVMYTPLHGALPFVLLGIGVDDSFVIADAFDSIGQGVPIPERTSRALSHAGVSITITSVTDLAAFAVSSSTSLPALSSFCIYATFGVLFLFIFQVFFFSAFLAIDAKRQYTSRPDILCCITVELNGAPSPVAVVSPRRELGDVEMTTKKQDGESEVDTGGADAQGDVEVLSQGFLHRFIEHQYAPFLMKPAVKVVVLVVYIGFLVFSIIGATQLSVESADRSFIPDGSYLLDTLDASDKYFGENGLVIDIVLHNFDQFEKQHVLADIQGTLAQYDGRSPYLEDPYGPTYDSWYNSYLEWLSATNSSVTVDANGRPTVRDEFYSSLHSFLQDPDGQKYNASVIRSAEGTDIEASKVAIQQKTLAKYSQDRLQVDAKKSVEAMDDFRSICNGFDGPAFPWTGSYVSTESLKSIQNELSSSIGLSLMVVFLLVLVLIGSPLTSLLITLCVVSTIIGLLGVMFYWDLVIDGISVINLVLAIGLAVDYSAHVGHAFMLKSGSRDERSILALGNIGAAVLNGALSTFLAIMLLSVSESYVFRVMFKQFFATVLLGAAHGLILLPVILSLIGPPAFSRAASGHTQAVAVEEVKVEEPDRKVKGEVYEQVVVKSEQNNEENL